MQRVGTNYVLILALLMIPALQLLIAKYLIMNQSVLVQTVTLVIQLFHAHYVGLN